MFLRSFGKILRGRTNWFQVAAACMLGSWLGFVPGIVLPSGAGGGFMQSPGLVVTILLLAFVLNTNLALFGIVFGLASLLSVLALPVSFQAGRWLLDGPLRPVFESAAELPVLAWFGLEYYATTGGLLVGTIVGAAATALAWLSLRAFRRRMATLEEGSAAYQKWSRNLPVRIAAWVVLGGDKRKKLSYADLLEQRRIGNPVRITGLVAVLVLGAAVWFGHEFVAGRLVQRHMRSGLERVNGATVDLASVQLDLAAGVASVKGLAITDPEDLGRDTFRAGELTFALGTADLLRRRLVIDEIASVDASMGLPRETPGRLLHDPAPPPPPPDGPGKTIEDYLKQFELWRDRLQQVSKWLETIGGDETPEQETPEQRRERIEHERELRGYAAVPAEGLRRESPMLWIRKLRLEGLRSSLLGEDLLDIRASNLSSNPSLVGAATALEVGSRSGRIRIGLSIDPSDGQAGTNLQWRDLDVDSTVAELKYAPVRGGKMALAFDARLDTRHERGVWIDAPLVVTLEQTTLTLPGIDPRPVGRLVVPIGLRGPLTSPRITLDDKALADALIQAGQQELANEVQKRLGEVLQSEQARKAQQQLEELQKKLPPGLPIPDIFGGKKKDG
jgi:uncharacterized protein (TIGR03546 family)